MNEPTTGVSSAVLAAYDAQYSAGTNETEWRELGGRYKAENILALCAGRSFPKVLDCGAGEGAVLKYLDASDLASELFALYIADGAVRRIQNRGLGRLKEAKTFDGYRIPYPDQTFDMAYCSHVIEHVEHPRLLLRELKRVSRLQVFEIPLDYALGVDREIGHFLAYGHISVYTPTLFRFLLKSEGYEILGERFTTLAPDVERFILYRNQGRQPSWSNELKLRWRQWRHPLKRILYGKRRFQEFGCSAYACLAKGDGELKVM